MKRFDHASPNADTPVRTYRTQRTRPIVPGESVYLDGNALLEPGALGASVQFAWRFIRKPEGSRVVLTDSDSCRASFIPDFAGRYLVRLEARTSSGVMRVVKEVRVSQDELTPVAVAKAEAALVMTGAPIRLCGAATENPLAGSLSYEWRISAAPSGSIAMLSYAASEAPMIFPDLEGRYEITLSVRNAAGIGTKDKVEITVVSPQALNELTDASRTTVTEPIDFGRTYSSAELKSLKRAVHVTTTPVHTGRINPRGPESGGRGTRTWESRPASSPRYASLIGHIRTLLSDGVGTLARRVESAHDFNQPAVSRR